MTARASTSTKEDLITEHIEGLLQLHQASTKKDAPLIIGLQGPQGSGKTTVTQGVCAQLRASGRRVASLSIDDLYLTHTQLAVLQEANPSNPLLHGRGLPGTHDVELGRQLLTQLNLNIAKDVVCIPVYDKSLFDGQGDRDSIASTKVTLPVDVVLFEGWCLGFYPNSMQELTDKYDSYMSKNVARSHQPFFTQFPVDNLLQINRLLEDYVNLWYEYIDGFVQLVPTDLLDVFDWRMEAEHAMRDQGKPAMHDEEVKAFVTRYMPAYELFGKGVHRKDAPWHSKGLCIVIDKQRCVRQCSDF